MQEDIGLKVVTDGEYNRGAWHRDFLLRFDNVRLIPSKIAVRFHSAEGTREQAPPSWQVTGKLARPQADLRRGFPLSRLGRAGDAEDHHSRRPPSCISAAGARRSTTTAYPDMEAFYADLARVYREEIADLAAAGCRYLQIDEVNLAYLCDPALRAQVSNIGEDPASLPQDLCEAAERHDRAAGRRT